MFNNGYEGNYFGPTSVGNIDLSTDMFNSALQASLTITSNLCYTPIIHIPDYKILTAIMLEELLTKGEKHMWKI